MIFVSGSPETQIYQEGNLIDANLNGFRDGTDTGWAMFAGSYTPAALRFDFSPVATDAADTAYERVLAKAGASQPRDSVDQRIVDEVRTATDGSCIRRTSLRPPPTSPALRMPRLRRAKAAW